MAGLTGNARKIADLFWAGKETAYAVRVETSAPRCFGQSEAWRGAMVVDSGSREGHAWDSRKIDFFVKNVVPFELWLDGLAEDGEIETALLFATLKALPAALPDSAAAVWVENGTAGRVREAA